ncbi:ral guanine nucleotide dissociation stimulator-like [Dendronephthya gigantea]|uniref:ral guanine nucleotide dissociation stimulator-like n=1 Tax=Dendronephthya gigantea TaxID=151771 RepID=UPI00106C6F83|nr:ral guanine nucleotide dissociation stimulator-like [Dendronephthya gigantea]XP_028407636.1 ral guanine nucleotide dissociation stimulator-like [Dendronephthya gigantea]XP_028407637.1 ral guanine nucleotide dissociation stimulator-like [Dendronephthya gigantea]
MKMPFNRFIGNRHSLNLEQLRRQQWQESTENITLSQIARPLINGEAAMLTTPSPEQQTRDWGDEREDGAIYRVVLKKVRYHTTNKLPFNDEFVSHLEWETQKRRTIKAGTLVKLIEHLAPANDHIDDIDTGFLTVFLTMHPTFSTSEEVVALLIERFKKVKKKNLSRDFENFIRVTVNVLLVWLENFPGDFTKDSNCKLLKQLQMFAKNELKEKRSQEVLRKTQQLLENTSPSLKHEVSRCSPNVDKSDGGESAESVSFSENRELVEFAPTEVAEQLTLIDAELFKAVIPRECVGCVWSGRDKKENKQKALSVKATVNQFNAVSRRVTTTILFGDLRGSPSIARRSKRLEAWIEIAQGCRDLKNFSSLKAIMSALQSAPIHRLKKTWCAISRNHHSSFEELSALVSEESNQNVVRELLKKEGTAKTVELKKKSSLTRKGTHHQRTPNTNGNISGTVPYLGTFLTDLMMLDTAYPDMIDGNLINYEKRQKEFEVIAQIRLFQEAAKNYYILPNNEFRNWFDSLETLTENEYFTLSCSLESGSLPKRQASLFRSRKLKSENDLVKASSFREDLTDGCGSINHKRQNSGSSIRSEGCPMMFGSDGHIIRVSLQSDDSCNLYKSIRVNEGDRTPAVIKKSLTKHHIDGEQPNNWTLVQILPNGNEVVIPKNANVYYAMATNNKEKGLYFLLRENPA